MTKKWIAINVLLLAVTGLLARQLYLSVLRFDAENDLSRIQPAPRAGMEIRKATTASSIAR